MDVFSVIEIIGSSMFSLIMPVFTLFGVVRPITSSLFGFQSTLPKCNFDEQFHRFLKRELGLHIFTNIEDVKAVLAKYDGLVRPSLARKARYILRRYTKKLSKGH